MRFIWLVLFAVLLLGQLLAFLSGRMPARNGLPAAATSSSPALASVAAQTRDAWLEAIGDTPPAGREGPLPGGGTLLERGQLLLQLRDAETELARLHADVRISRDLDAWIRAAAGRSGEAAHGSELIEYIGGLLGWLQPFITPADNVVLERSFLNPDSGSPFPTLAFELKGAPSALGARLLEYEDRFRNWHLRELDLNRTGSDGGWWLRGSYAFGGDSP